MIIQSPTGQGKFRCKNGQLDTKNCDYDGGWSPSQCSSSQQCDCSCYGGMWNGAGCTLGNPNWECHPCFTPRNNRCHPTGQTMCPTAGKMCCNQQF